MNNPGEITRSSRLAAELKVAPTLRVSGNERVVIISDLHIGDGSKADLFGAKDAEFLAFLDHVEETADKLIILGDCFDFYVAGSLERILKAHKRVLRRLKQLADEKEVIYVAGNHDEDIVVYEDLLNFKLCERLILDEDVLVVHGHEFDMFFQSEGGRVGTIFATVHAQVERVIGVPIRAPLATFNSLPNRLAHVFGFKVLRALQLAAWLARKLGYRERSRRIRRFVEFWNRSEQGDLQGLFAVVRHRLPKLPYRALVCGHTHQPGVVQLDGKQYVNTGTWAHDRGTYVVWDKGEFRLHDWLTGIEFSDELYRPILLEGILPLREWLKRHYRGWFRFRFDRDPCAFPVPPRAPDPVLPPESMDPTPGPSVSTSTH